MTATAADRRLAARAEKVQARTVEANNLLSTYAPEEEAVLQADVTYLARHLSDDAWSRLLRMLVAAVRYGAENAEDVETDDDTMPDEDYERAHGPHALAERIRRRNEL
jgi:hypothetical protein